MSKSSQLTGLSSTSQVLKRLDLKPKQLRVWEDQGLVKPTLIHGDGETNKYKYYNEATIRRINIIKIYRELGFPLKDIRTILSDPSKSEYDIFSEQGALLEEKKKYYERMILMCNYISRYGLEAINGMHNPAAAIENHYMGIVNAIQSRIAKFSSKEYEEIGEEIGRILIISEINHRTHKPLQSEQTQSCVESLLHVFKRFFSFTPNALMGIGMFEELRNNPIIHNQLLEVTTEETLSYLHDALFTYYLVKFEDEVTGPLAEKINPIFEAYAPGEFDAYDFYTKVSDEFFSFCVKAHEILGIDLPVGLKSYAWPIFFTDMPDDSICNVKDFNINEKCENFYQLLFFFGCKYLDENRGSLEPEFLKHDKFLYKDLIDA